MLSQVRELIWLRNHCYLQGEAGFQRAGFQRDSLRIYFVTPVPLYRINAGMGV